MTREQQLINWAAVEFDRRTQLLREGEGQIDWIDPGTRVSWTEIVERARDLGITMNVVELRHWWDENKPKQFR